MFLCFGMLRDSQKENPDAEEYFVFHSKQEIDKEFPFKPQRMFTVYFPEGIVYYFLKALIVNSAQKEYDYEVKMLYSSMHNYSKSLLKRD